VLLPVVGSAVSCPATGTLSAVAGPAGSVGALFVSVSSIGMGSKDLSVRVQPVAAIALAKSQDTVKHPKRAELASTLALPRTAAALCTFELPG
jgi:hypothetical protein